MTARASSADRIIATGRVVRVFFSSEKFSAGALVTKDGDEVKIAGALFIKEGDRIRVSGTRTRHEKYGEQIKVESFSFETALDADALVDLMTKDARFRGIGPSRARKIVEALGSDFQSALEKRPVEEIAEAAGTPPAVIATLREVWLGQIDLNRTMAGLARWEVSPGAAKRLFDQFGASVIAIVEKNPYWLIGRVRGFAFKSVDKIALAAGVPKDHPARIEEALKYTLSEFCDKGHSWSPGAEIIDDAEVILALDSLEGRAQIEGTLDRLVGQGEIVRHNCSGGSGYWPKWLFDAETAVVEAVLKFGRDGAHIATAAITPETVTAFEPRLNERQIQAVIRTTKHRVSVVTGGAGVGKTFTIRTIAALHVEQALSVALCAPTGKAARRMVESVGMPAQTIHMLLGPKAVREAEGGLSFSFEYGPGTPLDVDVVIVDEFSMVDISLARHLLAAIDFKRTSLVLVGDHNQLQSVGPGALLRDLVARPGVYCPVTVLDQVVRQAGLLKENVSKILSGEVAKTVPHTTLDDGTRKISPWIVVNALHESDRVKQFLGELFHRKLAEFVVEAPDGTLRKVDPIWDVQLLTPMHRGSTGTIELNRLIQSINQGSHGREVLPPKREGARTAFMPDDKVVAQKNDYQLGIMNGTIGRVLELREGAGLVVDFFEDGVKSLNGEQASSLGFAYALSVHKSQGSEWPIVIYVCHKGHQIMFSRNLFYTGVSRSRRAAIIVGDVWAIDQCAKRLQSERRRTLLALPPNEVGAILDTRNIEGFGPSAEEVTLP